MNVTEQFRDVMHRTMTNLEIVEKLVRDLPEESQKPFEVTQLVNSVMGAVAWPRERELSRRLEGISIDEACNEWHLPSIVDEYPNLPHVANREKYKPDDLDRLMTLLRHSFAHGNFRFIPGGGGQIESVQVWNVMPENSRLAGEITWGTTLTIHQLRDLLYAFVRLADYLYSQHLPQSRETMCEKSVSE